MFWEVKIYNPNKIINPIESAMTNCALQTLIATLMMELPFSIFLISYSEIIKKYTANYN